MPCCLICRTPLVTNISVSDMGMNELTSSQADTVTDGNSCAPCDRNTNFSHKHKWMLMGQRNDGTGYLIITLDSRSCLLRLIPAILTLWAACGFLQSPSKTSDESEVRVFYPSVPILGLEARSHEWGTQATVGAKKCTVSSPNSYGDAITLNAAVWNKEVIKVKRLHESRVLTQ